MYLQLIFSKSAKTIQWKKDRFSMNGAGRIRPLYNNNNNNIDPYSYKTLKKTQKKIFVTLS